MNAYNLMGFLLLFNISVSIVLGLGIYADVAATPSDEYDVEELRDQTGDQILGTFGANAVIGLVGGIALGGALSWVTQIPGDAAFAYSVFIGFYWAMAKNTIDILISLATTSDGSVMVGVYYVIIVFLVILGLSFMSFVIQLVRGPWASMK